MAKCNRCQKFLFMTKTGYCRECELLIQREERENAERKRREELHKLEEQRKLEEQEARRKMEEEQRKLEEQQRKLEEQRLREEQRPLLQSLFELRRGIHFGDDIDEVKQKEANSFNNEYNPKAKNRIAFHGTIAGIDEYGQTIFTFNDVGLLINMEYSYIDRFSQNDYFLLGYGANKYTELSVKLQKDLTKKYGPPVYIDDIIKRKLKKPADGEQYSLVMKHACQFDECYQLKNTKDNEYASCHGWILNENNNDIIIHLLDGMAMDTNHYYGYEYLELGYTIVKHDIANKYISQDIVRMELEREEKESRATTYYNEL